MASSGRMPDGGDEGDGGAPVQPRVMSAADFASTRDWPGYFRVMSGKPARETLTAALDRFRAESVPGQGEPAPLAVDLGCGEGRDTLVLLERGWRVLAVDGHPAAFEHLLPRVPAAVRTRLDWVCAPFTGLKLPPARLVNASFALPFCEPADFSALWKTIVDAVEAGGRGGRFAGQFFGPRDSWAALPDRSHHSGTQVRGLLSAFDIEEWREEERDAADVGGAGKHWQVFHVVARRR